MKMESKRKNCLAILLSLLLALGLAACGGSAEYSGGSTAQYAASAPMAPAPSASAKAEAAEMPMEDGAYWNSEAAGGEAGAPDRAGLPDGVKMIYRANLELQTTEFEKAAADVRTLTQSLSGYFEEQSVHNYSSGYRSASYTVRVPAERFDDFLLQIGELCHVTYQSQSAEDVSESYYDMESRLETARIKLDRLQELLSRAELMEDIITLESAISETEYQIERLSGELRHYDALIGYSTIYVTLQEVYRVTETDTAPLTFAQRVGTAFRDGLRDFGDALEDLAEWLAYSWLTLLALALILFGAVKLIRRAVRGGGSGRSLLRRKKNAPAEQPEEKNE